MSLPLRRVVPASLSATLVLLASAPSMAASWQTNVQYGGNMSADYYVPDVPADPAPVLVSLHFCGGTKGNAQQWFRSDADEHGFIIITPQAGGNCFDAGVGRSGERAEVVKMIEYAVSEFNGDPNRAYAAGASSGACMAHALLASYPEVFAGGSSLAGTPAGAWTGGNNYAWSAPQQSDEAWGDVVRDANPTFTGPWPRMQIWHGQGDTNLTYSQTYPAEVAQWTNVWGLLDGVQQSIQPPGAQDNWDRTTYADANGVIGVEANSGGGGVPHDLTGRGLWGDVVRFLIEDEPDERLPTGMGGAGGEGAGGVGGAAGAMSGAGGAGVGEGGAAQGGAGMAGMPTTSATAGTGMTSMSGATSMSPAAGGAGAPTGSGSATGTTSMPTGTGAATGTAAPTGAAGMASAGAPAGAGAGSVGMTTNITNANTIGGGCSVYTSPLGSGSRSAATLGLLVALGFVFRRRRSR